jgi:hypothetical protein
MTAAAPHDHDQSHGGHGHGGHGSPSGPVAANPSGSLLRQPAALRLVWVAIALSGLWAAVFWATR